MLTLAPGLSNMLFYLEIRPVQLIINCFRLIDYDITKLLLLYFLIIEIAMLLLTIFEFEYHMICLSEIHQIKSPKSDMRLKIGHVVTCVRVQNSLLHH